MHELSSVQKVFFANFDGLMATPLSQTSPFQKRDEQTQKNIKLFRQQRLAQPKLHHTRHGY